MHTKQSKQILIRVLAILLTVIIFTPLVIPSYQFKPFFIGLPYTIWAGFTVSALYSVLIYFEVKNDKQEEDGQ